MHILSQRGDLIRSSVGGFSELNVHTIIQTHTEPRVTGVYVRSIHVYEWVGCVIEYM
jgi:hypothetical protein